MELYIDHVSKQFKDKLAVDDVNLHITPGVWGLLGANGAGKTTLMRIIAGIMKPTSGKVLYDGLPITTLKERYWDIFGYLPQEFGFYPEFSVQDYLDYVAALKGLGKREAKEKTDELLEKMSLTDVRKMRIKKLSGGMRRRVGIAQALLNDPEILILDEPTSGLDPGERVRMRKMLSEFAINRIVLISTHIVSDVEYIASYNAIMKDGRLIEHGTTSQLVKEMQGKVWECRVPSDQMKELEAMLRIVNLRNDENGQISIRYLADEPCIKASVPAAPRLEDLFLWRFPQGSSQESS